MNFFKYLFIVFIFILYSKVTSQTLGKHDKNIGWKSIESENVKVIYPKGTTLQAQRIADVIEYIHKNKTKSVGDKSKKIDIVLQNQQTISNGFVTLSPYRSEFFAISPQDQSSLGTTNWLDLLSIHEYRHALQYANAKRGLTKFFHILAGQNGWAAVQRLSIPSWYMEGDAVLIETLLSENGRGRNPYFFKEQRALFLENKVYSYHKAQNGSYKDIVPNIYALGFMISNYIRNEYEIETGSKILADAGKYRYGFYPFSSAMKKHTGLTTTKMYKKSAAQLKTVWGKESKTLSYSKSKALTEKKTKTVTHYTFPQYLNDGSILAIKRSFKQTPSLVKLKNNKEEKLTTIGISAQEYISVTNDIVVWTEHSKDLRHANKNYSNIVVYNISSNTKKTITSKKRYFSPNYSCNNKKIIAVNYNEKIRYTIDVLDSETGTILESIPNPFNDFVSTPKWTNDEKAIIYLVKRNSKLAFFKYSFNLKQNTQLSDWTTNSIGQYSLNESEIFFTASYSGIDNIYSIDIQGNKNLKQISSVKVGAYFPNISTKENKILYSEFTSKGYKIYEQFLKKDIPQFKIPALEKENYYNLKTTDIEHAILDSIPENKYSEKDYKGFLKGTKLHSWGITTSTTTSSKFGTNIQFQNILNDFTGNIVLFHNQNEGKNSLGAFIGYGKGLLSLNLKASTLERRPYATISGRPVTSDFKEIYYGAGFSIPLSQYKGNYSRSFNFETNYIHHVTSNFKILSDPNNILFPKNNLNFGAIESSLTLSNIRRIAYQNVAPRFGQYLKADYSKSLDGAEAEKISINSIFYFPGIFQNHSFNMLGNWQKELLSNPYQYSDSFSYARGYNLFFNDEVSKISLNYELPLLYPDFGVWGLTYFKRIRLNVFFDASVLNTKYYYGSVIVIDRNQNSYGGELIFDNIYFNIAPISLGLRQSMLLNTDFYSPNKTSSFELFFRIGF